MTNDHRVKLWDAINRYATACGGDPSKHVYGNTTRQKAVAEVEATIREVEAARSSEAPAVTPFQRELLAKLPTFTPGMDGRLLEGDDLRAARRLVLSGLAVRTSPHHFARAVAHINERASRKARRKLP